MIRFDNVTKRYDSGRDALTNISLEVAPGELIFLTGRSGAGKSTLLKLIALIERPTRGQIFVGGRNVGRLPDRQIPKHRRQIGMVFQDHKLLEDRSIFDNVALPMIIAGYSQREIKGRAHAALDQVGLLNKEKNTPGMLSTGEQQRVGIARAVVARPKVLIADEPTGNLDPDLALEIMNLFREINARGTTVVVATHDRELIRQVGRRAIMLEHGVITEESPAIGDESYFKMKDRAQAESVVEIEPGVGSVADVGLGSGRPMAPEGDPDSEAVASRAGGTASEADLGPISGLDLNDLTLSAPAVTETTSVAPGETVALHPDGGPSVAAASEPARVEPDEIERHDASGSPDSMFAGIDDAVTEGDDAADDDEITAPVRDANRDETG